MPNKKDRRKPAKLRISPRQLGFMTKALRGLKEKETAKPRPKVKPEPWPPLRRMAERAPPMYKPGHPPGAKRQVTLSAAGKTLRKQGRIPAGGITIGRGIPTVRRRVAPGDRVRQQPALPGQTPKKITDVEKRQAMRRAGRPAYEAEMARGRPERVRHLGYSMAARMAAERRAWPPKDTLVGPSPAERRMRAAGEAAGGPYQAVLAKHRAAAEKKRTAARATAGKRYEETREETLEAARVRLAGEAAKRAAEVEEKKIAALKPKVPEPPERREERMADLKREHPRLTSGQIRQVGEKHPDDIPARDKALAALNRQMEQAGGPEQRKAGVFGPKVTAGEAAITAIPFVGPGITAVRRIRAAREHAERTRQAREKLRKQAQKRRAAIKERG